MKKNLPILRRGSGLEEKPSIDAARAKLGGPIGDELPAFPSGAIVTVEDSPAVVVYASAGEVHVLVDNTQLRRMSPGELELFRGEVPLELQKVGADAHLYGQLVDGDAVRYTDMAGTLLDGRIVEKCRYGALIERDDGIVVAVGFRKIWPAGGSSA